MVKSKKYYINIFESMNKKAQKNMLVVAKMSIAVSID